MHLLHRTAEPPRCRARGHGRLPRRRERIRRPSAPRRPGEVGSAASPLRAGRGWPDPPLGDAAEEGRGRAGAAARGAPRGAAASAGSDGGQERERVSDEENPKWWIFIFEAIYRAQMGFLGWAF